MEIYYLNSKGDKIALNKSPYRLLAGSELFNYKWGYETRSYDNKTVVSERTSEELKADVIVSGKTVSECLENAKEMLEIIDYDLQAQESGRLYVGSGYMKCWIVSSKKDELYAGGKRTDIELSFIPEKAGWLYETKTKFYRSGITSDEGMDYGGSGTQSSYAGFDYGEKNYDQTPETTDDGFDYTINAKKSNLHNDAVHSSEFEITVYGDCLNPSITINGHEYKVNVELEENEYMKVNSVTKKIQVNRNGTIENVFQYRDKESYIFEKIKSGNNIVLWSGEFDFEVNIIERRSEPTWT